MYLHHSRVYCYLLTVNSLCHFITIQEYSCHHWLMVGGLWSGRNKVINRRQKLSRRWGRIFYQLLGNHKTVACQHLSLYLRACPEIGMVSKTIRIAKNQHCNLIRPSSFYKFRSIWETKEQNIHPGKKWKAWKCSAKNALDLQLLRKG